MVRARGLILLEVVVSLVLIATAVTALLLVQGRSLEQLAVVRQNDTAAALADELIRSWKLSDASLAAEGRFATRPGWCWTRATRPYAQAMSLSEVTLIIERVTPKPQTVATYSWLERVDEGSANER